ncbi:hypothetical protein MMC14_002828 [Varicellaria rhodocarpa]|nr:hypothetical protein [Varicellaria rhodocarpa]
MIIFINPPKRKKPPVKAKAKAKAKAKTQTQANPSSSTKPYPAKSKSKIQTPPTSPNPPKPPRPSASNGNGNGNGNGNSNSLIFNSGPPPSYSSAVPLPQPSLLASSTPSPYSQALAPYPPSYPPYAAPLQHPWNNASQQADRFSSSLSQNTVNNVQETPDYIDYSYEGPSINDLISTKLNALITSIDGEAFSGDEKELVIHQAPDPALRGGWGFSNREISRAANNVASSAITSPRSTNHFAKATLYANSKLPPNLPPLKLYLPSYPLICLAAQYSERVYTKPTGKERETHIEASSRLGTKAMVIKSIPIDDRGTVVFAIRGSQTFMDWAVNLNSAPTPPMDFLDDPGNMCHSGFLSVARKMIRPVAARLRSLLEEDPSRASSSLLMTGHSAGGAVASLLYAHMMAEHVKSELNVLTGCFKRIHCITFGAPPVTLLPLGKPIIPRYRKSLFISFINEGDPVPRADKAYVRSLINLYASPAPGTTCISNLLPTIPSPPKFRFVPLVRPKPPRSTSEPTVPKPAPIWNVPSGTLSNAGRLVVLRSGGVEDEVKAEVTNDQQLRSVVFGDPIMHMMKVYARRVEVLATKAVTAKIWN